jgi:hypothetical protein
VAECNAPLRVQTGGVRSTPVHGLGRPVERRQIRPLVIKSHFTGDTAHACLPFPDFPATGHANGL